MGEEGDTRVEGDDGFDSELRRTPRWLFLGGLAVAVGAALALIYRSPPPDTVAIAVRGCSQPCTASLRGRLAYLFEERGFAVVPSDASTADALDDRAGGDVAMRVFAEVDRVRTLPSHEARVTLVGRVRATLRSSGLRATSEEFEIAREANDEDHAMLRIGLEGLDAIAPELIARALMSEPLGAYLDDADARSSAAIERQATLRQARRDATRRARAQSDYARDCDALASEVRDPQVTCVTEGCAEEYLVANAGGGLVTQTDPGKPVIPFDNVADIRRVQAPETVSWVREDGRREPMTTVADLRGYANSEGESLAMILRGEGVQALVVRDPDAGERVLLEVPAPGQLVAPTLSPDGAWVAFGRLEFADGQPQLYVTAVDGESEPRLVAEDTARSAWVTMPLDRASEAVLVAFIPAVTDEARAALIAQGGDVDEAGPSETADDESADDPPPEDEPAGEAPADDVSADDTPDDVVLDDIDDAITQRVEAGMPLLAHLALYRVTATRIDVVARAGGSERSIAFAPGVHEDALVVIGTSRMGCALGRWTFASPEPLEDDAPRDGSGAEPSDLLEFAETVAAPTGSLSWRGLAICPRLPSLAGGALYAEAWVAREDDVDEADTEVVRVDLASGEYEVLTANAIRERHVQAFTLADGSTRVAFERLPRRRYARMPAAAVCYLSVPAPVAPLETPSPDPPHDPPPPESP